MSEFQNVDEFEEMVRHIGADRITNGANLGQNLINITLPSEVEQEPPPAKMRLARPIPVSRMRGVDQVNVLHGAPGNIGIGTSGGSRASATSVEDFHGRKKPNPLTGTLVFSLDEIEMAQGPQAVDRILNVFDAAGSGAGKYLARSLVDPLVSKPATDQLSTATEWTVPVMNGYWPGQTYEIVNDGTGIVSGTFRVLDVEPAFDGTAVITFDTANGQIGYAIDVSDESVYLLGQSDAETRVGSIADATDDTLDLYDIDIGRFPAGMRHDLSDAAVSKLDLRRLISMTHTASGDYPTHVFGSPLGIDGVVNDQQDSVRFVMGQSADADMDPYADAMAPMFSGLPMIREPTYNDDVLDVVNVNYMTLREYWPYRPRSADARPVDGQGRSALVLDQSNHAAKVYFDGGYGTVFTKRRCHARLEGVSVAA